MVRVKNPISLDNLPLSPWANSSNSSLSSNDTTGPQTSHHSLTQLIRCLGRVFEKAVRARDFRDGCPSSWAIVVPSVRVVGIVWWTTGMTAMPKIFSPKQMNSTGFYQPGSFWNDLNICVSSLSLRHQTITRPNLGLKEKAQISKGGLWSSFPLLGGSVRTHCCWPRQITTLTCLTLQPLSPLTTHCDFFRMTQHFRRRMSSRQILLKLMPDCSLVLLGTWGSCRFYTSMAS